MFEFVWSLPGSRFLLLLFAALALACSDEKDAADGLWRGKLETGTQVTLELWIQPTDPELAAVEAFRSAAGGPEAIYGKVTARNTTQKADKGRFVVLTGGAGYSDDPTEVIFVCGRIPLWLVRSATGGRDLQNQYFSLVGDHCNSNTTSGPDIAPGETVTYYVVLDAVSEPAFERVFMGATNELKR